MSSFNQDLNDKNQFIIRVKVVKSTVEKIPKNGEPSNLIIAANPKGALIDTGASNTCITQEYAKELQLIPISKTSITTAGPDCEANIYKIDLAIPVLMTKLRPVNKDGKQAIKPVVIGEEYWAHTEHKVLEITKSNKDRGFDVILGMDILNQMHITMFGGQIIMSF